jgi:cellulose synthase/poly-beta-1,6-N-acetylglucosamine synthase-like glycosyltransferase
MSTCVLVLRVGFWVSAALILYTYALYPVFLFLFYGLVQLKRDLIYLSGRGNRRVGSLDKQDLPCVSIVMAAHNEEFYLPMKLENLGLLDYPSEKLEIVVVSDGSTDRTVEILRSARNRNLKVVILREQGGKASALNAAVAEAAGDILLLVDASAMLRPDGVHKLARHFQRESVGAVCGALEFSGSDESKKTEGIYWRYESVLRIMEARLGATLTASGAYYAIRRRCFVPLSPGAILDDFLIPMRIRKQGYEVLYDPEAIAQEFSEESVTGEFRRRVRLATGSFRALPELIWTPMPALTRFCFISHKVLRWLMPLAFIALLICSALLINFNVYGLAFVFQALFYMLAVMGMLSARRGMRLPGIVFYFFVSMNVALLVGLLRGLKGGGGGVWQRAS